MSRQKMAWSALITIAFLVAAEIVIDAIAGDFIKQYINENIPLFLGILAVLAAIWLRVWKYEGIINGGGSKMVRTKLKGSYGGLYNKEGRISILEAGLFILYTLAAVATFGLGSVKLTWITDFSFWIVVLSALGVYAVDKQYKKNQKLWGIEIGALSIAIGLPLAAAGYLTSIGIDISEYLADPNKAFIMLIVSVGALIVAARAD